MAIAIGQQILASDVLAAIDAVATRPFYASDTLRNSNDTEKSIVDEGVWHKLKEVLLNADLGACRIKFDLWDEMYDAHAQIYKNGVAIGILQTNITGAYVTYSEDFTGFVSGNLIQIYVMADGDPTAKARVRNMRFYYDKHITLIGTQILTTPLILTISAISMTNQDP